jgi:hypothetical protein
MNFNMKLILKMNIIFFIEYFEFKFSILTLGFESKFINYKFILILIELPH